MARALLLSGLFAVSLSLHAVDGVDRPSAKAAGSNLAISATAGQLATARRLASLVGGRIARIADSGSMEPQLTGRDLAIFIMVGTTELYAGDIVIYRKDSPLARLLHVRGAGVFICHRIVRTRVDGSFETMGDANDAPDPSKVQRSQILGIVRYAVDTQTGAVRKFISGGHMSQPATASVDERDHRIL
jgi:signal peptidase I